MAWDNIYILGFERMNDETINIGNISTVATWLGIILYPLIVKYGIDIDQETVTTFIYTLIVIIIAVWSSYNPNTFGFLKNDKVSCNCGDDEILNDEYTLDPNDDMGDDR